MFDALLRETETASLERIENTIKHASTSEENLWWDGYLYRLPPVRCCARPDSDYVRLVQTYFNRLKRPAHRKKELARLILGCIADLPDVFEGTGHNVFSPVIDSPRHKALIGTSIRLHSKLIYSLRDEDVLSVYRDPGNLGIPIARIRSQTKRDSSNGLLQAALL